MRLLLFLFALLFSGFSFAQNTGIIIGNVLDNELNNDPLAFANVSVKDSNFVANSDLTGLFHLENLEEGKHILVFSFAGYETKELEVEVISGLPTDVKISLSANRISLNDLASVSNISGKDDKVSAVLNN